MITEAEVKKARQACGCKGCSTLVQGVFPDAVLDGGTPVHGSGRHCVVKEIILGMGAGPSDERLNRIEQLLVKIGSCASETSECLVALLDLVKPLTGEVDEDGQ